MWSVKYWNGVDAPHSSPWNSIGTKGEHSTKAAAAAVLTSPFVPLLFAGEEWAASTPFQYFTDHDDPELGKAVTEGRRREFASFGWDPEEVPDPQDPETFRRSKLDWDELSREPHAGLLDWHRRLIELRRTMPAPAADVSVEFDEDARWLVLTRGPFTVAANMGPAPATVPVGGGSVVLASADAGGGVLPPESVVVLKGP